MSSSQENFKTFTQRGYNFGRNALYQTSGADSELWNLMVDVPRLSGIFAILCAAINCFFVGVGTILSGVLADKENWNKT